MNSFKKLNVLLSVILFCLSCTVVFGQQNQKDEKKQNQTNPQKNAQKTQADVFDANTATLEESQKWLKNTLVMYGSFTTVYDSGNGNRNAITSRVENVKFNGCEMTYTRVSKHDPLASTGINTAYVGRDNLNRGENISPFNNSNDLFTSSRIVSKAKINLANLNFNNITINDLADVRTSTFFVADEKNPGKIFWMKLPLREDTGKDAFKGNVDLYGGTSYFSTFNINKIGGRVIIGDKQIANQARDAFVRAITLCQQKQ